VLAQKRHRLALIYADRVYLVIYTFINIKHICNNKWKKYLIFKQFIIQLLFGLYFLYFVYHLWYLIYFFSIFLIIIDCFFFWSTVRMNVWLIDFGNCYLHEIPSEYVILRENLGKTHWSFKDVLENTLTFVFSLEKKR
jgi:hypothetical protein